MKLVVSRSWILSWLGAFGVVPPGDGRSYRLNDLFPMVPGGDVVFVDVSRDGRWIVYTADAGRDDVWNLYSVPTDGSRAPVRLTANTEPEEYVNPLQEVGISPDGTRVLFLSPVSGSNRRRLFSVPIDGSASPVDLVGPHALRDGRPYQVTPDSRRVLVISDYFNDGKYTLCSLPIDGSAGPFAVNNPLAPNGDVTGFQIGPDGVRVVYRADQETNDDFELFSARVDVAQSSVKLSGTMTSGGDVGGFQISADGARVVYRADQLRNDVDELFSVPIDGSAGAVRLSAPLTWPKAVNDFALSPDGARVVYLADQVAIDVLELFSVPIDGSAGPVVLNSPLVAGGDVSSYPLLLGSDGARVVYRADQATDGVYELFSVPIDGSAPAARLNGSLQPDEDVSTVVMAPDGEHVAFQVVDSATRTVFSVPVDAGSAPIVLDSFPYSIWAWELVIGSNSRRVVYRRPDAGGLDLWSALLDGTGAPIALSSGEDLGTFRMTPGGAGVLYTADEDESGVLELFARPASGAAASVQISPEFPDNFSVGHVSQFRVAGDRAVYGTGPLPGPSGLPSVYVADQDADDVFELYAADGLGPPVKLGGAMVAGGDVNTDLQLSPDGAWVFYRADALVDGRTELFRVPSDGSTSPVALSGTIVSGGGVRDGFRVTPDASRVLFRANRESQSIVDLYTVPADASAPPLRLDSVRGSGSTVQSVLLDPSGTVAVFHFNAAGEQAKLWRAPVDGSSPQVLLTPIANGGRVLGLAVNYGLWPRGIQISADGSRAAYLANADDLQSEELYSVPIDASAPPTKLNHALSPLSDVDSFRIDPSGRRVVYASSAYGAYSPGMYAVPIDRAREPVELSPPLLDEEDIGAEQDYAFTPDGSAVLYRFAARQQSAEDLYAAPLEKLPRQGNTPGTTR